MAFSEEVIKQAWERVEGQCECRKRTHSHFYAPCGQHLVWGRRGKDDREGWEARRLAPDGGDVLSNCIILCSNCGGVTSFSMPI